MVGDEEKLRYIEDAGEKNFTAHLETSAILQRESVTTVTVLLAGAGAALGFAAKQNLPLGHISFSAICVSVYLFALSAAVVQLCLKVRNFPAPANEPKNLNAVGYELSSIRWAELDNLQARIEEAQQVNSSRTRSLNNLRLLASGTPFVAILSGMAYEGWEASVKDLVCSVLGG
ncbi:hypothetical protein [Salinisphaera dokdonensis]|uniref:hypothetical protein n=1 Tax=Salinisphaera dokdonensis TaxID=454598 RepID=UPI00334095E0